MKKKIIYFIFLSCMYTIVINAANTIKTKSCTQKKQSQKKNSNFHPVEEKKLYRSGQLSEKKLRKYIQKYKIKTIINLRGENKKSRWFKTEQRVTQEHNVKLVSIPMQARTLPSKENLLKLLDAYDTEKTPILIHCYNGTNRTGEAAALWFLYKQHKNKKEALKQLSSKYGYTEAQCPAKRFLISIWESKKWAIHTYNPKKYPQYS